MKQDERVLIIEELLITDKVFLSIDKDLSVVLSLRQIFNEFENEYDFYFANGGDQDNNSIEEFSICKKLGIGMIDGLGDKIQSSSWLLKK